VATLPLTTVNNTAGRIVQQSTPEHCADRAELLGNPRTKVIETLGTEVSRVPPGRPAYATARRGSALAPKLFCGPSGRKYGQVSACPAPGAGRPVTPVGRRTNDPRRD
jgi:hypothetical protein